VVEDAWQVAKAVKSALAQVGMIVFGPAATAAEARRFIAEHMPRLALKRETSCSLIGELADQGVGVIVVSGYTAPPVSVGKVAAILQKPFSGSELLSALSGAVTQLGTDCKSGLADQSTQ
jgi:hypothetical protein